MNFGTARASTVNSEITISGADVTPTTSLSGLVPCFEQTHWVKDSTGKFAQVYAKVVNAQKGLTYKSKVLPREGKASIQPWVSAEQWLTVPKADSLKCTASASYGPLSVDLGLEEKVGSKLVTLTKYDGKAYASATQVSSSQTATDGSADSIEIYGHAKDISGSYGVDTTLNDISGVNERFTGLIAESSAGSITQVTQKEHIKGGFDSEATAVTKTNRRTSNYGNEYDLNMIAKKSASGPSISGLQGYYVNINNPRANEIQKAVDAAQSGDTINVASGKYDEGVNINKALILKGSGNPIVGSFSLNAVLGKGSGGITAPVVNVNYRAKIQNGITLASSGGTVNVAAGTYKENVIIDKSLVVNGAGKGNTIVDGSKKGSVFTIGYNNPKTAVTLLDMTVQGGSGKSIMTKYGLVGVCGGGVLNYGKLTVTRSTISGNTASFLGGGIYNVGTLTVLDSTLSKNTASWGGGVYNYGSATVTGSNVLKNAASNNGGGFYSCCSSITTVIGSKISENTANGLGGGIAAQGILTIRGSSTISGNTAKSGGGIGWKNRRPIIDPTTVVTGNSNPQIYPY